MYDFQIKKAPIQKSRLSQTEQWQSERSVFAFAEFHHSFALTDTKDRLDERTQFAGQSISVPVDRGV